MGFGLQMIFGWMCIPLLNEITNWGLCFGLFRATETSIAGILVSMLYSISSTEEKSWFIFITSILTFISSLAYIFLEIIDSKHNLQFTADYPQVSLKNEVTFENILLVSDISTQDYNSEASKVRK